MANCAFLLPAEGDLKSGIPAFVDIPAPHIMTMFLNLPSLSPFSKSASENPASDLDIKDVKVKYILKSCTTATALVTTLPCITITAPGLTRAHDQVMYS